jgi:hypothetical protein
MIHYRPRVAILVSMALVAMLTSIFALSSFTTAHASLSSQISASPDTSSIRSGDNLTISVILAPRGNSINVVQTVINYNSGNFSFVSIVPAQGFSSFPYQTGNGIVTFSAGTFNPVSTTTSVATLTLHATGSGNSSINIANACGNSSYQLTCSAVYDASTNTNDLVSIINANVYVSPAPVAPGVPSSTGSSSPAATSTSGASSTSQTPQTTPSPPLAPTQPIISGLNASNITTNGATISWKTNVPTTSVVNFGINDNFGSIEQNANPTTDHKLNLGQANLPQGTTYYYQASGSTPDGTNVKSPTLSFVTQGFEVTVMVVDAKSKPIVGAIVTIGGLTGITNQDGQVVFSNLTEGTKQVIIKASGSSLKQTISVGKIDPKTGKYEPQNFRLVDSKKENRFPAYAVISLLMLLPFGALIYYYFTNKVKYHLKPIPYDIDNINSVEHPLKPSTIIYPDYTDVNKDN